MAAIGDRAARLFRSAPQPGPSAPAPREAPERRSRFLHCDLVTLHEAEPTSPHGPGDAIEDRAVQLGAEIGRRSVTVGQACAVTVATEGCVQAAAWFKGRLTWVWEPMHCYAHQQYWVGPFPLRLTAD